MPTIVEISCQPIRHSQRRNTRKIPKPTFRETESKVSLDHRTEPVETTNNIDREAGFCWQKAHEKEVCCSQIHYCAARNLEKPSEGNICVDLVIQSLLLLKYVVLETEVWGREIKLGFPAEIPEHKETDKKRDAFHCDQDLVFPRLKLGLVSNRISRLGILVDLGLRFDSGTLEHMVLRWRSAIFVLFSRRRIRRRTLG